MLSVGAKCFEGKFCASTKGGIGGGGQQCCFRAGFSPENCIILHGKLKEVAMGYKQWRIHSNPIQHTIVYMLYFRKKHNSMYIVNYMCNT